MKVKILRLNGTTVILTVEPSTTIFEAKCKKPKLHVHEQQWNFNKKNLGDGKTFEDCGVKDGDQILLFLKIQGG